MSEQRIPPVTDVSPTPGATAILRTVEGAQQIVVVCERCDSIHTVTVDEAMRIALDAWMKFHSERHAGGTR